MPVKKSALENPGPMVQTVQLDPGKRHGLVREAPRLDERQRMRQHGISRPEKKAAVWSRTFVHRQVTEIRECHAFVVRGGTSVGAYLVAVKRVADATAVRGIYP